MFSTLWKIFELDKIAINLLLYQQSLIVSNIVNINTKNYQAKDINFKKEFIAAVKERQKNIENKNFLMDYSKIKLIPRKKKVLLKNNSKEFIKNNDLDIERLKFLKNSIIYQKCIASIKKREKIFFDIIGI
ncbi:flagellar basal body rod protein FlgB [Buchnera aphidicola]|uniref:flagellar basal body rod protein FlgB n=1 Tax=Buchnera aphidicola TaxID=9 RepID=UPI00094CB8D2|nr:hypothetical protein [Buchnera aphidicola]